MSKDIRGVGTQLGRVVEKGGFHRGSLASAGQLFAQLAKGEDTNSDPDGEPVGK
jgi:hypothetical protein